MEGAGGFDAATRADYPAPAAKHSSAYNALEEANDRLHGVITSLEQRLEPVLRPDPGLAEARGDHLGSSLDGQVDVTRNAYERLGRLIDRLAV